MLSQPIARRRLVALIGAGAALGPALLAACTPAQPTTGASPSELNARLQAKEQEIAKLQAQVKSQAAPSTVVQAGQLQPAPSVAQPAGWDTPELVRGRLRVVATYDSKGPTAWDPKAHPLVYFTSEGQGYSHRPSKTNKLPGVQLIDATTRQVVTSAQFDLGYKQYGTPHGLGASPDGRWLYMPTTENTSSGNSAPAGEARLLIIDAQTLKLSKILTYPNRGFHHITAFKDWQGRDRVLVQTQQTNGAKFLLDPTEDNRVVKAITAEDVGYPMGHPYSTVDPTGKFLYIGLSSPELREAEGAAGVAKVDLDKGAVKLILGIRGGHPIGIVHTADGKFTYVADAESSRVYKLDNATDKFAGFTSAGVAGPYGLALNWNETELWTVGKGEGSHNTGGVMGIIDTKLFGPARSEEFNQPIAIGGAIIDHAILHPDPSANELWVSSAGTWETIVVDAAAKQVKTRIPSPHGGDTHSGAFVWYGPDFRGELLADMGGPQKPMYATRAQMAAAAK
jgi:DNA-binding beta-propeller fold protein YncE